MSTSVAVLCRELASAREGLNATRCWCTFRSPPVGQTEREIHTGCNHLHQLEHAVSEKCSDSGGVARHEVGAAVLPHCPVSGTGVGGQGRCLDERTLVTHELNESLGRIRGVIRSGVCPNAMEGFEPARLMCCSGISQVVFSAHCKPLDAEHSQRRFSSTQEKAIISRDRTYRCPRGGRALELCEMHHEHEWNTGRATTTDNMVLRCFHHQYVHSERIITHTGGFVFTRNTGEIVGILRHETRELALGKPVRTRLTHGDEIV